MLTYIVKKLKISLTIVILVTKGITMADSRSRGCLG